MRGSLLGLLVPALLLIAGAGAARAEPYLEAGSFSVSGPPAGIAVDNSTGAVYVMTTGGAGRVWKFSANGEPLNFEASAPYVGSNALAGTPTHSFSFVIGSDQLAVDNSGGPLDGDIFVTDQSAHGIDVFARSGEFLGRLGPGVTSAEEMISPCGVAAANGEVYSADAPGIVDEFEPSGPDPTAAILTGQLSNLTHTSCALAVDGQGQAFVSPYGASGGADVYRYEPADFGTAAPVGTLVASESRALAADEARERILVDTGPQISMIAPSGEVLQTINLPFFFDSHGVAVNEATRSIYASSSWGSVAIFKPDLRPVVTTGGASAVGYAGATVSGEVDPAAHGPVTECRVEYGRTTSYGENAPCALPPPYTSATAVSVSLTGLDEGATYHYRFAAVNAEGTGTGSDRTFAVRGGFHRAAGSPIPVAGGPQAVAAGDLDGNGTEDLAIADANSGDVTVLLGNGSGGFTLAPGGPIPTGDSFGTSSVAIGDMNDDGSMDIVAANSSNRHVAVLLGDGTGGFAPAPGSPFAVGGEPRTVSLGDLNGDGKLDVATNDISFESVGVLVLDGNGDGSLSAAAPVPTAIGFSETVGDFNGDGNADIVGGGFEGGAELFFGDGTGLFSPAPGGPLGESLFALAYDAADMNGDGNLDLVASTENSTAVVLLSDGAGGFAPAPGSPYAVGQFPLGLSVADFNGDGRLDFAATGAFDGTVSVMLAHEGGYQPAPGSPYPVEQLPVALAGGDFSGDGRPDLVTVTPFASVADVQLNDLQSGPTNSASGTAAAGGTVATNEVATPEDPVGTSVTSPQGGQVSISEGPVGGSPPAGYEFFGQQIQIEAPPATAADPLVLAFVVDASLLPANVNATNLQVYRDGAPIENCTPSAGSSATPDPCVAERTALSGGDVRIVVRTSHASTWNIGMKIVPETTVVGPNGLTNNPLPVITFSSSEPGSTFQCRFDSESFRRCRGADGSDRPAGRLADGPHSFEVRAIDADGDPDPSPARVDFVVDTMPPETTILSAPSGLIAGSSATFAFSSSDATAGFECQLDSQPFAACASPRSYANLARGGHVFRVRALDPAGNADASPAAAPFAVK